MKEPPVLDNEDNKAKEPSFDDNKDNNVKEPTVVDNDLPMSKVCFMNTDELTRIFTFLLTTLQDSADEEMTVTEPDSPSAENTEAASRVSFFCFCCRCCAFVLNMKTCLTLSGTADAEDVNREACGSQYQPSGEISCLLPKRALHVCMYACFGCVLCVLVNVDCMVTLDFVST